MTQMLLFDSSATTENFTTSAVAVADGPANEVPSIERPAKTMEPAKTVENDADRGGIHHMGDLARLVLMRYELVAQRRAAQAARRAN